LEPGVIVAIITALAGLMVAIATRRKTDAETHKATTEAVLLLLRPLNERVGVLEGEVAILRKRIAEFRYGVRLLCGQITELGAQPVWTPDDED
jgi:hypothetical protein